MLPHRQGKIILLASLLTYQGGLTVPAYASAKGGIGQLVKALANEWSAHNVHVNGIVPGYIDTDMNAALLADPVRAEQIAVRIPAGRWGKPEDFAGPSVFLASRASQYVCGELLVVDGVRNFFFFSSFQSCSPFSLPQHPFRHSSHPSIWLYSMDPGPFQICGSPHPPWNPSHTHISRDGNLTHSSRDGWAGSTTTSKMQSLCAKTSR
jgi:Enoyl-(Acyl carrier protein) reductase